MVVILVLIVIGAVIFSVIRGLLNGDINPYSWGSDESYHYEFGSKKDNESEVYDKNGKKLK